MKNPFSRLFNKPKTEKLNKGTSQDPGAKSKLINQELFMDLTHPSQHSNGHLKPPTMKTYKQDLIGKQPMAIGNGISFDTSSEKEIQNRYHSFLDDVDRSFYQKGWRLGYAIIYNDMTFHSVKDLMISDFQAVCKRLVALQENKLNEYEFIGAASERMNKKMMPLIKECQEKIAHYHLQIELSNQCQGDVRNSMVSFESGFDSGTNGAINDFRSGKYHRELSDEVRREVGHV